ncbi:EamA family transporter [Micromonospora sp. DH15]|nr:EamA family transporter [Micromonospora sp. DH15]
MPEPTGAAAAPSARPALIWAALAVVYVLWGSTYLAIRVAVESLPALASAGLRFGAAAAVLALFLRVRRGAGALRVDRRQLGSAALVGVLLLAGGNGLVVLAESGPPGTAVPSGIAALLVATVPLLVVLLRTLGGDRPRVWTFAGVTLGFLGLVLLVLPTGGSVGSYLAGRLRMPTDPFVATVYEMVAGAVALTVLAAARGELRDLDLGQVTGRSWLALAYLMVAGSLVAFTAYVGPRG